MDLKQEVLILHSQLRHIGEGVCRFRAVLAEGEFAGHVSPRRSQSYALSAELANPAHYREKSSAQGLCPRVLLEAAHITRQSSSGYMQHTTSIIEVESSFCRQGVDSPLVRGVAFSVLPDSDCAYAVLLSLTPAG